MFTNRPKQHETERETKSTHMVLEFIRVGCEIAVTQLRDVRKHLFHCPFADNCFKSEGRVFSLYCKFNNINIRKRGDNYQTCRD